MQQPNFNDMYSPLEQDIKYLQGVGPNRAKVLEKELSIRTIGDLLVYYPYKHVDRSQIFRINELDGNMPYVQLRGEILSFETLDGGKGSKIVAHFSDGTGVVDLVWFQGGKWAVKAYDCHVQYIVFGKPTVYGHRYQIAHPEIERAELLDNASMHSKAGRFMPAYNTTERMKKSGLNSQTIAKLTANMFVLLKDTLAETLPDYIRDRYHLLSYDEAIRQIHYPTNADMLRRAQARLKFEELFYVQLNILRYVRDRQRKYTGLTMSRIGTTFNTFFYQHLPFTLTEAQKRVIRQVREDMRSGKQMNRLLQGDVGSGKTLVALMCMLIAVDNGFQACIMAPTEILAEQHLETIRNFLGDMPVRVELLTGSVKGKARRTILEDLSQGKIHLLVGTHALIEDGVVFDRLGLVVIDEQHRFGVAQRAKLWQKSDTPPHVLVMTATPIPRTLAMTLYGDLDVSVIDELPPGRKPIQTIHKFDAHRKSINMLLDRELRLGRQAYVVYPLIKESESLDEVKDLEMGYQQVCHDFPQYKVSMVHGKMKPAEKDAEMQRFANGETQIMVATTVIEVGVNVPNASVMVIENAERFGLSQLHQLRGRVGRGADQSYCILVSKYKISNDTRKRIQIMVDSTDGFEIAEYDLKLRGPGDLEGTQQSGMAFDLKIANIARDGQLLQLARDCAAEVIDDDPNEENPLNDILWFRLRELRKTNINWGAIS